MHINIRGGELLRFLGLGLALILLNQSLAFENVWPTLKIRATSDLSLELAFCILSLIFVRKWVDISARVLIRSLSLFWLFLILGHYVDVTTRSLYGREVSLYWDMRHIPNVGAMFSYVADPGLKVALVIGLVVLPIIGFVVARWSFLQLCRAIDERVVRGVLGCGAAAILLLGIFRDFNVRMLDGVTFSNPVLPAAGREVKEFVYEMTGEGIRSLGPAPVIESNLSRVDGSDVILISLESYGAVSWSRQEFIEALEPARIRLKEAIDQTRRGVKSAFVEATTFGGESWLSHISLLSGSEVRDERTSVRLMAQQRDTMVKLFSRNGYRTVAVMPGLLQSWPEGAFYGFDDIYDYQRLNYNGPPFGWWGITDQFSLARVDSIEIAPRMRSPVFMFFATVTTHAPFTPTPPYQADWARVLTSHPHDVEELDRAWSDYADWTNLGPSYVKGLQYAYATLEGYLRLREDRDVVMIIVGDHQPPSLVSGEAASWNVPIHVIANQSVLLDRLSHHQFREGLKPQFPSVARMDTMLPILLDAFGETGN